ncbi:hypothetical protein C8R46DRAFT_1218286 [Mycena filopes]|nr:hypothetical protein C8R46DRAFT_1218286 [Mycena filopes]
MSSSIIDSRLPTDLEREIFTTAASVLHARYIPNIMLVARRVHIWVAPILYRSFVVCHQPENDSLSLRRAPEDFRRMFSLSPTAAAEHVRNLCIATWVHPAELETFLEACPSTESLAIFGLYLVVPGLLPAMAQMPLRRLTTELLSLFGVVPGLDEPQLDFKHPIFSRLTHLSILDTADDNADSAMWTGLATLPCLTHLSFAHWHLPPIFDAVLASCHSLEVFVLKCPATTIAHTEGLGYFAHDPRAVVVVVPKLQEDWEAGADGGRDYWAVAERFIERRRKGEIEASEFIISSKITGRRPFSG